MDNIHGKRKWERIRIPIEMAVAVKAEGIEVSPEDITFDGFFVSTRVIKVEVDDAVNLSIHVEGKTVIKLIAKVKRVIEDGFGAKINKKMTRKEHLDMYYFFLKKCKRQM